MNTVYQQTIRREMESKEFFDFGSKLSYANAQVSAVELDIEPDETGTKIRDHSKLIKGQFEGICFPVVFKQKYKGKFTDILDTGWANLYLISEKLKKLLEDS